MPNKWAISEIYYDLVRSALLFLCSGNTIFAWPGPGLQFFLTGSLLSSFHDLLSLHDASRTGTKLLLSALVRRRHS